MNAIHIITEKENIAPLVLLPGDPLRAKYIAENYLQDAYMINNVRNMLGYTGTYKGKRITVIGSGMGIPSVGIYAYELYKFYDVEKIIRIGSAGSLDKDIHIRDILLCSSAYSDSNFRYALTKSKSKKISSSNNLNQLIINTAKNLNIPIKKGTIYTSEVFDVYAPIDHLLNKIPENIKVLGCEMEAFGLFTIAKYLNKEASCLVSISDSKFESENNLSAEERQITLNQMIYLALESIK
jgi:purine-nucleoside phosphorylase